MELKEVKDLNIEHFTFSRKVDVGEVWEGDKVRGEVWEGDKVRGEVWEGDPLDRVEGREGRRRREGGRDRGESRTNG